MRDGVKKTSFSAGCRANLEKINYPQQIVIFLLDR